MILLIQIGTKCIQEVELFILLPEGGALIETEILRWNNKTDIFVSDVDDTIAEVFQDSSPEMISELEALLSEDKVLFLISGQSVGNICRRVVNYINRSLRNRILIGHCNGSEVYGFTDSGELIPKPLLSAVADNDKIDSGKWKSIIYDILKEFGLIPLSFMDIKEFRSITKNNPHYIMLDDRKVQISLDFVNGLASGKPESIEAADIRLPISRKAKELFNIEGLPIEPHLSGTFALDFNIRGVDKSLPIKLAIKSGKQYQIQLPNEMFLSQYNEIEVWGDSFSKSKGGSDCNMSLALPKETRSISFREVDTDDTIEGYNIVIWNGKYRCHEGLLEYLKSRKDI